MAEKMTFEHDLASLSRRIAKAERSRDAWRATAGGQERYLEACSMVGALDLQLEKLHQAQSAMTTRLPSPSAGY
jgi:hypothetical protein